MKQLSLFTKFTILIVLATVIGLLITHFSMTIAFENMRKKLPVSEVFYNVMQIIASQIDISDNDSTELLLDKYGFELRYIKGDFQWASSGNVPDLQMVNRISKGKKTFWYHKDFISVIERGNELLIFMGTDPLKKYRFPWWMVTEWSILMVALFAFVHYQIRILLKPVKVLHEGVLRANEGDFKIELQQSTNDELGQLIQSFNSMALKVRNDIKSRDQLLRDISHELRSPLSRMMVALEFVPEGRARDALKNNIMILEKMTSSIIEEERIDSPYGKIKKEICDLNQIMREVVDCRIQSGHNLVFKEFEPLYISVDKERIRMAISNVVDNGIKYSDNKPITINYLKTDQKITIEITDQGIGIQENEIPFIFEPFYRVDKARKNTGGYGLGMSLTKKIIDAHGGTINIESLVNIGTTVKMCLPVS